VIQHSYGKARVRLVKVKRKTDTYHEYKQLSVRVLLAGDFVDSFVKADNTKIVATDTCKNLVYVVARDHPINSIESFAISLADKFLSLYDHVSKVDIKVEEYIWDRIVTHGKPHPHSFIKQPHVRTTHVISERSSSNNNNKINVSVESGVENLNLIKTTGSSFEHFYRDSYTTLPEAHDRLFGTNVSIVWKYGKYENDTDFDMIWKKVEEFLFVSFAEEFSVSVQQTMYSVAEKVMKNIPEIEWIKLTLPNLHNWTVDFTKLGLQNTPDLLTPVNEPHGLIQATFARKQPTAKL